MKTFLYFPCRLGNVSDWSVTATETATTSHEVTTSHERLFKTTIFFFSQGPIIETSCKRRPLLSDLDYFLGRRFNTFSLFLTSSRRHLTNGLISIYAICTAQLSQYTTNFAWNCG